MAVGELGVLVTEFARVIFGCTYALVFRLRLAPVDRLAPVETPRFFGSYVDTGITEADTRKNTVILEVSSSLK